MSSLPIYVLSIETTGELCGICLHEVSTQTLICEYTIYKKHMHDFMLAELVRRTLLDFSLQSKDIGYLAVSEGPGSYTGIRIGMSFAKGWCFESSTTLISVPTLSALAKKVKTYYKSGWKNIAATQYSHSDLCYIQIFDFESLNPITSPTLLPIIDIHPMIDEHTIICGSAVNLMQNGHKAFDALHKPNQIMIAEYALDMVRFGHISDDITAESQYHSEFQPK